MGLAEYVLGLYDPFWKLVTLLSFDDYFIDEKPRSLVGCGPNSLLKAASFISLFDWIYLSIATPAVSL